MLRSGNYCEATFDDNSNADIFTHKNRGISWTLVASNMELFVTSVTLVNSFQALTNITKNAIIDVTSANSNAFPYLNKNIFGKKKYDFFDFFFNS